MAMLFLDGALPGDDAIGGQNVIEHFIVADVRIMGVGFCIVLEGKDRHARVGDSQVGCAQIGGLLDAGSSPRWTRPADG